MAQQAPKRQYILPPTKIKWGQAGSPGSKTGHGAIVERKNGEVWLQIWPLDYKKAKKPEVSVDLSKHRPMYKPRGSKDKIPVDKDILRTLAKPDRFYLGPLKILSWDAWAQPLMAEWERHQAYLQLMERAKVMSKKQQQEEEAKMKRYQQVLEKYQGDTSDTALKYKADMTKLISYYIDHHGDQAHTEYNDVLQASSQSAAEIESDYAPISDALYMHEFDPYQYQYGNQPYGYQYVPQMYGYAATDSHSGDMLLVFGTVILAVMLFALICLCVCAMAAVFGWFVATTTGQERMKRLQVNNDIELSDS